MFDWTVPITFDINHDPKFNLRYNRLKVTRVAYVKLVYKNSSWADSAHGSTPLMGRLRVNVIFRIKNTMTNYLIYVCSSTIKPHLVPHRGTYVRNPHFEAHIICSLSLSLSLSLYPTSASQFVSRSVRQSLSRNIYIYISISQYISF